MIAAEEICITNRKPVTTMTQSRATYRSILITYLRPHWPQVLLLLGLLLTNTGLKPYNPRLLAGFVDAAVGGGAMNQLVQLALLFLGVALVTQLTGVMVNYLAANVGLRATNRLRSDLLLHTLRLDMSFHNEHTPSELIESLWLLGRTAGRHRGCVRQRGNRLCDAALL